MSHFNMGWPCPWRSLVFFLRVFGAMPCLLAPRGHAAKRIDHIPQRRPQYLGTDLDNMVNTCQYLSSTLVKLIFWQSSAHCAGMCQVAMLEVALFVAFHDWMFHCIWVNGKLLLMLAPSLSKSPWQLLQTMCLRSLQMKEKKQFLPGFYPFSSKYPPFSFSLSLVFVLLFKLLSLLQSLVLSLRSRCFWFTALSHTCPAIFDHVLHPEGTLSLTKLTVPGRCFKFGLVEVRYMKRFWTDSRHKEICKEICKEMQRYMRPKGTFWHKSQSKWDLGFSFRFPYCGEACAAQPPKPFLLLNPHASP